MITSHAVHRYNSVANHELGGSEWINLWSSMQSLCDEDMDGMLDGLHMPVRSQKQATMVSN